ncbi:Rhs-family protein [Minicystis rosea]|nr:Rhs-family protein [Minicystis rosea]
MTSGRINRRRTALAALALALGGMAQGFACGGSGTGGGMSTSSGTGGAGHGGAGDGGSVFVGSSSSGGTIACTTPCDAATQICSHGVCVPLSPCKSDNDCQNDTKCDPTVGCVPWDSQTPAHDPGCISTSTPGVLQPKVRCEFSVAPAGDPFPGHVDVQGTPIVVNFNKPASSGPPSIAASFTATVAANYTEDLGVIRVLRGTDCSVEANLGGTDVDGDSVVDWTVSSASLAAADLDGDGSAEIVAYGADGSTLAFTRKNGTWALLWKAPFPAGAPWAPCDTVNHRCQAGWAGASIYDLDDDGKPEIIREGVVFGADGVLRSLQPATYVSYSSGLFAVAANLDQDPGIEFTNGQYIWEWQNGAWVQETGFPGANASAPGHVAIADFGAYGAGVPAKNPEIVVVRGNNVMVYAIDGSFAQPPVAVPGKGGGGPPTVSDFDGDGLPEIAVAGQAFYTVYDIDCGPNPRPGGVCSAGPCDFAGGACPAQGYIAWSRATQDLSSNVTGSSVFDFEADGNSEVVYGDECFTRVYDGKSGEVVFSQYRSSCTWYENPVVADVDGNFRADLVSPSNKACAPAGQDAIACQMLDENGVDKLFAGLRCKASSDCASGVCDSGLCRCTSTAQCCASNDDAKCVEEGYVCAPPPAGTAGTGNTCRAGHPHGVSGIRVYSDANDKWVRSRTIWNQHPYAVTHVNEDGTVPKTSTWANNWDDPKLNNFRQNVPGNVNGLATGDATAGPSDQFACSPSGAGLSAPICNRGSDPIGGGLSVGFYVGGNKVCGAKTTMALQPDACEVVGCTWATPPTMAGQAIDVDVVANDDGAYQECKPNNGHGTIHAVFCKPAG